MFAACWNTQILDTRQSLNGARELGFCMLKCICIAVLLKSSVQKNGIGKISQCK